MHMGTGLVLCLPLIEFYSERGVETVSEPHTCPSFPHTCPFCALALAPFVHVLAL